MSFRDWSGTDLATILKQDGFVIPAGITDDELRVFAEETYGDPSNLRLDNNDGNGDEVDEDYIIEQSDAIARPITPGDDAVVIEEEVPVFESSHVDDTMPAAMASSAMVVPINDDEDEKPGEPEETLDVVMETLQRRSGPRHHRGHQPRSRPSAAGNYPGWAPMGENEIRRNEADDEARFDVEAGENRADNFAKPTLEAALEYASLHHPRTMDGRPYPYFTSTMGRFCFVSGPIGVGFDWLGEGAVSEMARYGTGLSLHFKILKFLFWMFLFATCLGLPQLVLNSQNTEYGGGLFITTIGNLFPFSNRSYVFLCASASASNSSGSYLCQYTVPELSYIYSFTNLSIVILFVAGLLWVHYFVEKEPSQVAKLFLSLDKYSVWIPEVPPGCGEIPLAQYFEEMTGEAVDEVNIAFDEGALISSFFERGEVLSELWRATGRAIQVADTKVKSTALRSEEEMQDRKVDRLERIIDYFDLLLSTYHSLNEETRGFSKRGTRAISAIVTFERREGALKAIDFFRKSRSKAKNSRVRTALQIAMKYTRKLFCCLFCSPSLAAKPSEVLVEDEIPPFQGMYLTAETAPPPSAILWENLEFKTRSRVVRQLFASLVVCVAIGASFGASFGSQAYRAELRLSRETDCNGTTLNPAESSPFDDCTCGGYAFARASSAIFEASDPCHEYWMNRAPLFAFTLFATAVVAFVNFAVTHLTISLSQFERHHSLMGIQISVAARLVIAYSVNTAFVYVIVNVLLNKKAYELDSDWYSDVGIQILITMLLNVIAPHFQTAYDVLSKTCVRKCGDRPLLQREMNERYIGGEFPFAVRSAQVYMQTFICLCFGPGMPLLYPIAVVSFTTFFLLDKWTILRFYRTPPEYDAQMAEMFIVILWVSLFSNLCFAIWTYSAPGLFWDGEGTDEMSSGMFLVTRSTLPNTVPLLILLIFLVCLWFATYTLCFTWRSAIRSSRSSVRKSRKDGDVIVELDVKDDLPPLYEAKASGYLRGLKSYNILQNPKYRRAFGVPKSFCDEHSHVNSVLALPGGDVLPELPDHVRKAVEEY